MSSFPKKHQPIPKMSSYKKTKLIKVAVQSEGPEKIFMIECDASDTLTCFKGRIRPRIPELTIGSMYWKGVSFFFSYS